MRINFKPVVSLRIDKFKDTVIDYDLVTRINPSQFLFFDNLYLYDEQSYTDNSRYVLNLYKVRFNRCHKYSTFVKERTREKIEGLIQVIELDLNFDMNFDFRLLANDYIDLWKNDNNIDYIRPFVQSYERNNMGYYAFRSLATSFIAKAFDLIHTRNILCFKKGRKIILAYNIENYQTENNLDDILDYFLDGIYEMVKCTQGRFNYPIPPESGMVDVNMEDFYKKKKFKRRKKKTKECVTYVC